MSDCGEDSDPRPIESLEKAIPTGGQRTWGVEDWEWDPQTCQAIPKRDMRAEQQCNAPPLLAQALPLQNPTAIPSVSEGGTAGTVSAVADDSGGSGGVPGGTSSGGKVQSNCRPGYCQADGCGKNLSKLTFYHVRNKICDIHIKADDFSRDGVQLRFCQKCGNAHPLAEFDGTKHSCRAQLEKHNARRRKRQAEAALQKQAKQGDPEGAAAAKPPVKTKRGGRRQQAVPVEEDGEPQADAQATRRSNRKRRAVPIGDESEEEAEVQGSPMEGSPLLHTSSAAPKPEEAKQSKDSSPPTLPLLGLAAGDDALPAASAPQALNFGDEDLLPDDLSSWLIANLSEIEDLGWPALDGRSPSPPRPLHQSTELGIVPPNLPEGGSSFDFAARLMQLEMAEASGEASGSTPAPTAALPSGPKLTKEAMLSIVSVKLFGCTPAELPDNLRSQLLSWFDGQVASLDGYMRPGCVHLTVQATVAAPEEHLEEEDHNAAEAEKMDRPAEAQLSQEGGGRGTKRREPEGEGAGRALQGNIDTGGVVRLVEKMLASGETLWRTKTLLVQTGREVALVHGGKLQQTWDMTLTMQERVLPAVLEMKPIVLLASSSSSSSLSGGGCLGKAAKESSVAPAQLIVQGINLLQDDCEIVCRLQGDYVPIETAKCLECRCAAAVKACCRSPGRPPSGAPTGGWESRCCGCCVAKLASLSLEDISDQPTAAPSPSCCGGTGAKKGSTTKSAAVNSVTPQLVSLKVSGALRPGVLHIDVLKKAYMAPRGGRVLVVDSPAVHAELLTLAERALPATAAAWVEALSIVFEWVGDRNKVTYSVVERTASRLIHEALAYGLVEVAKYLHGLIQSAVMDAAASLTLPKNKAVGALDALAMISQADQACRTATMIRIGRLGCVGALSLLHRAVQSQEPAVVELVVAWGQEADQPWRCDLSGPRGLTPLHLATLVRNPVAAARIVLTLVSSCEPGVAAWKEAATIDDLTPADFAAQLNRTGLLDAFGSEKSAVGGDVALGRVAVVARPEMAHDEEVAPSTPRRCKCSGPCPCALSAEPCAGCDASSDDDLCCGEDGTCSCCSKASKPDEESAPPCCGGGGTPPAPPLPPVRTCCH